MAIPQRFVAFCAKCRREIWQGDGSVEIFTPGREDTEIICIDCDPDRELFRRVSRGLADLKRTESGL